ncbi:unnamed protein product [Laminaria digitata]
MESSRVSLSFVAVLISVLAHPTCVDGFFVPAPACRPTASGLQGSQATGINALSTRSQPAPRRMHEVWRRQASMSARQPGDGAPTGSEAVGSPSRLSRISRRVRKMIRKAVMGYLPEEEMSYKQTTAKAQAEAAALRDQYEVANPRLQADGVKAQEAAAEAVDNFEDEDDILGNGFVRLNIGDQTPKEAEDAMTSLRKRLEKQLPPDTDKEQAEKRRIAMQQQQQQPKAKENPLKPPKFDGDTAVAERPSPTDGARQPQEDVPTPRETPKLASAEDVERLNRMFGSMGGEPLR